MVQKIFRAFGTINSISVFDRADSDVLDDIEARMLEMDARWSVFRDSGDISAVNRAAGKEYVRVHPDTYEILRLAVQYSDITNGVFDITMQPLIDRWDPRKYAEAPTDGELEKLRILVGYQDILFRNGEIMLKKNGQAISLGAIAKGYAADKAVETLKRRGIKSAVINLGGTVAVIGTEQMIGLQDPLRETGISMGALPLTNRIAVTSGSYEREYVRNNRRYHHILDPRTGSPSETDLLSATLIGDSGTALDALATAVFAMGLEKGFRLIRKYNLQAVFVTKELQIFATDELKDMLTICV